MTVPFSRAAAESWADIFWAVDAGLIEPPPLVWGNPSNPFVIDVNRPRAGSAPPRPLPGDAEDGGNSLTLSLNHAKNDEAARCWKHRNGL